MLTLIKINLSGCLNLILCHTLFLILFRQPEKLNAMPLKRLSALANRYAICVDCHAWTKVQARNDTTFLLFRLPETDNDNIYNMPNCFSISFITWLNSACSLGVHTSPCAFGLMSDNGKIRILCMVYGEKRCFPQ